MAMQHGTILTGEQVVYEGPVEVQELTSRTGVATWTATFVMSKITIASEGNMILNLADGRSGEMYWLKNRPSPDGTTTVICQGNGPLK